MRSPRAWTRRSRRGTARTISARSPQTSSDRTLPGGGRHRLVRVKHQLLDAPVQHLGDVDLVLRRARDFVNPAELLELLSRLAEHAEHLAFKIELVDAPGKRV